MTALGSNVLVVVCLAGMFYFPYKAGRKFFQKYKIESDKINGFFLAGLLVMVGYFLDAIVFNILLQKLPEHAKVVDHFFDKPAIVIFLICFSIGTLVGFISKKFDKPIK